MEEEEDAWSCQSGGRVAVVAVVAAVAARSIYVAEAHVWARAAPQ